MDAYLNSAHSEFSSLDLKVKPLIADEFGVQHRLVASNAGSVLVNHLDGLVQRGFVGGQLWTWNWWCQPGERWWVGVEKNGDDAVADAFAIYWGSSASTAIGRPPNACKRVTGQITSQ
jgi:hypothetical protein